MLVCHCVVVYIAKEILIDLINVLCLGTPDDTRVTSNNSHINTY